MKVLAVSIKGKEFFYKPETAHAVSNASWKKIMDVLNQERYMLTGKPERVWAMHEVDEYDEAYGYGKLQAFKVYKGSIRRTLPAYW